MLLPRPSEPYLSPAMASAPVIAMAMVQESRGEHPRPAPETGR
jgi:hypothetical protein